MTTEGQMLEAVLVEETAAPLRDLGFCVIELMGHRSLGGRVREERLFGRVLMRVEIPREGEPDLVQLYNGQSIYAITPCTEETARLAAATFAWTPPRPWNAPADEERGY